MKSVQQGLLFFLALILVSASNYGDAPSDEKADTRDEGKQTIGSYIDDSLITTQIKAAILDDSRLSFLAINVDTYQGNVQLSGFVDSTDDINRAVEMARQVEGVQSVTNNLQIKSSR